MLLSARPSPILFHPLRARPAPRRPCRVAAPVLAQAQGPAGRGTPAPLQLASRLPAAAAALAAAACLALAPPAWAELQTVPASEAGAMARPLKQQPVNKGRIWLLMVLGGTALFGSTVLLENNEKWFPAIFKANRALKVAQKKMERTEQEAVAAEAYAVQQQQRLAAVQAEREADARADAAVLAGLQQAKQQVLPAVGVAAAAAPVEAAAAGAAAADPPAAAPAAAAAEGEGHAAAAAATAGEGEPAAVEPQGAAAAAANGGAGDTAVEDAEPASKYPPLIFEPGAFKKVNEGAVIMQGLSDEQLEEALRRRQAEVLEQRRQEQQQQQ